MHHAVILLGSNIGDRPAWLAQAISMLGKFGTIEKLSSVYETSPWGKTDQDNFLNQVLIFKTAFQPKALLEKLHETESEMGRMRIEKWGPRIIDIDLLYFDNEIIHEEDIIVPHPGIPERKFTLVPLAEILPSFVHPQNGLSSLQMLENCHDTSNVYIYGKP